MLHIIGNRPHFIKLTPVYRAFKEQFVEQVVLHTGQHYDATLTDVFIRQFDLPTPDHLLQISNLSHAGFMGKTITAIDDILLLEKPSLVVVYGDTNSTAAGAIAAAKRNITLAHVEAGLREFDKSIPEEINKLLTDSVSDLLFAPTKTGFDHLASIGRRNDSYLVGDVGLDLIYQSQDKIEENMVIIEALGLKRKEYIFMTCHRAANTDDKNNLENILRAIAQIENTILFPIHPRTKKYIEKYNLNHYLRDHIMIIEPIGFFETQCLLKHAKYCITDSGGIIKEAYFHKTPSIIIDKQTEWVEIVEDGWTQISGPNEKKIVSIADSIKEPKTHTMHLGDGTAAKKIVSICINKMMER